MEVNNQSTAWRENILSSIVETAKRLYRRNLLAAADGNVSFKVSDDEIYITPSALPKAFLKTHDMAIINLKGETTRGKPSSEKLMHLEIYKRCPQARCVVHAHPPTAVAFSVAFPEMKELPSDCLAEIILSAGSIPIVPYARPSTEDMAKNLVSFLPKHRLMILARHGAVSWGESLTEALNGMERLEHVAQMLKSAQQLGGLSPLPAEEIAVLKKMREEIGDKLI